MAFPEITRLELPILQELKATGGSDQLRYLYDRLARYFPQLTAADLEARSQHGRKPWHARVQRAGQQLEALGQLQRAKNYWTITSRGLRRVEEEAMTLDAPPASSRADDGQPRLLTHKEAQQMLVEIGLLLGKHAEAEFEYYDVVWRDSPQAPRLSHVFEVQISGSVDSALTRLKHAYDAQRSRLFLVIADERDKRFAGKRLTGSFHEIWEVVELIGVGELQRLYETLKAQEAMLAKLATK